MSQWLKRLKNQNASATDATEPAKPKKSGFETDFVAFVASPQELTERFDGARSFSKQQTPAVNDCHALPADSDCSGWQRSLAFNSQELEIIVARMVRFTDIGLPDTEAQEMAERLVIRDRECDDRRSCLECVQLHAMGVWRCGNWQQAEVPRDGVPRDLVMQLQRCPGFSTAI